MCRLGRRLHGGRRSPETSQTDTVEKDVNTKKTWKWVAFVASGGVLLQLGTCTGDLTYYLLDAFVQYLPDLLGTTP